MYKELNSIYRKIFGALPKLEKRRNDNFGSERTTTKKKLMITNTRVSERFSVRPTSQNLTKALD